MSDNKSIEAWKVMKYLRGAHCEHFVSVFGRFVVRYTANKMGLPIKSYSPRRLPLDTHATKFLRARNPNTLTPEEACKLFVPGTVCFIGGEEYYGVFADLPPDKKIPVTRKDHLDLVLAMAKEKNLKHYEYAQAYRLKHSGDFKRKHFNHIVNYLKKRDIYLDRIRHWLMCVGYVKGRNGMEPYFIDERGLGYSFARFKSFGKKGRMINNVYSLFGKHIKAVLAKLEDTKDVALNL